MKRLIIAAALVLPFAGRPCRAADPVLADVGVRLQGDQYVASLRLVGVPTKEMLDEIEAGIETTVRYRLQVHHRRIGLPDEEMSRHQVDCSVRRDALSRQYTLTRRVDGELVEKRLTTEAAEMRAFLTSLDGVPVVPTSLLDPKAEYYLRARGDLGLIWRFYLIPWRLNTGWARVVLPQPGGSGGGPRD